MDYLLKIKQAAMTILQQRLPNTGWEPYCPVLRRPEGINGLPVSGYVVMRRRVMGAWQYREATPAEVEDYVDRQVW